MIASMLTVFHVLGRKSAQVRLSCIGLVMAAGIVSAGASSGKMPPGRSSGEEILHASHVRCP